MPLLEPGKSPLLEPGRRRNSFSLLLIVVQISLKSSTCVCYSFFRSVIPTQLLMGLLSLVNPTHEKYLNKKIDMYDEMAIVVGKDVARGSGAKSFDDVEIQSLGVTNLEEKGDGDDEFVKENDKQLTSSVPLESRKSRKRAHADDLELQNISTQMAEVVMTLQKISKFKLDIKLLYQEVMKTEGFEEDFLDSAFDHLIERENLVKGFLAKSDKLRRIWLGKFKGNN